uniref:Uncharacterized protein n=1 Tax=Glossina pallidipes TaxID=7398 RepID=A0A1A9Z7Q5_GLOPL
MAKILRFSRNRGALKNAVVAHVNAYVLLEEIENHRTVMPSIDRRANPLNHCIEANDSKDARNSSIVIRDPSTTFYMYTLPASFLDFLFLLTQTIIFLKTSTFISSNSLELLTIYAVCDIILNGLESFVILNGCWGENTLAFLLLPLPF